MRQLRGGLQVGLGEMPLGTGRVYQICLNSLVSLSEGSSSYPGQEINLGSSSQWETKPSAEAPPSTPGKVNSGLRSQTNYSHSWALHKRSWFINRTTDESRVPNYPGWTHLISLPSASECQKDYFLSHPSHQNQNKGMSLRFLQTVGKKSMSQSCKTWLHWFIRLS